MKRIAQILILLIALNVSGQTYEYGICEIFSEKKEITATGATITGLATGTNYKIWIVACDEFWNRSEISNVIEITTL